MANQKGNNPAPTKFQQYLRQNQGLGKQEAQAHNRDFRLLVAVMVQQLGEDEILRIANEALPQSGQSNADFTHLRETARLMQAWAKQELASQKTQ